MTKKGSEAMTRHSSQQPRGRRATHLARLAAGVFVLNACSGYFLASSKEGFEASQLPRAAFDLDCPVAQIVVVELASGSVPITPDEVAKGGHGTVIGVSGCGRKATYKYLEGDGWMAQTTSQKSAADDERER